MSGNPGDWKPGSKTTRDPDMDYKPTTGLEAAAAKTATKIGVIVDREPDCLAKAKERGQLTFTLVEQDYSSPSIICEWIKANIETCPKEKLFEALDKAIRMRDTKVKRKDPD